MKILLCLLLAAVCAQSVSVTDVSLSAASQQAHHTQSYRLKTIQYMIVRRGQPFDLKITTDSALGNGQSLSVSTSPSLSMTTSVSGSGTQYVITCQTQSNAPVGQFQITVSVSGSTANKPFTATNQPLVVLFNPYLQGDDVYMDDQSQLSEYIENEYENIWRGSLNNNNPMRWYLAQYNEHSLTTALQLLSSFSGDAGDVKAVSRHLSFAITYQSSNPSGLLIGNWGSNFNGGTAPWDWKGTDKITDQYVSSEFQPVKFAQCWVFGGTFLTLMRAMGIPSRQLTTFNSAHESPSDGKYTHVINRYYDSTGKMIKQEGSVWNFHSWNDAWMKRDDVSGASGWQAVDSTPQELSDGVYQMGPAPLYSIKAKDDNAQWDSPFVISEVAASIHNYQVVCSDGSCKITKDLGIDQEQVGGLITTSEPRTGNQQDITGDYKDLSSSSAAVSAMSAIMGRRASPALHRARYHARALETRRLKLRENGGFVGFLASDDTVLGQAVPVTVMFMGEPADGDQRVDFYVNVSFIDYRGMYMGDCMNTTQFVLLNKDNNYQAQYDFSINKYWQTLPVNPFLSISMYAENVVTEMALIESIQVSVTSPPLVISAPHFIFVNSTFKPVTISFTNPIDMPLTNGHLSVQGPNLNLDTSANFASVSVGQTVYWSGFIKSGAVNGTQSILASFDCDQFYGTTASFDVEVIGIPFEMQAKLDAAHEDHKHVARVKALSVM